MTQNITCFPQPPTFVTQKNCTLILVVVRSSCFGDGRGKTKKTACATSTPPMHLMISPPAAGAGVGDGKFSGEQRTGTTTTTLQTVAPPTPKTHIDQCLDDADRRRIGTGTTQCLPDGYDAGVCLLIGSVRKAASKTCTNCISNTWRFHCLASPQTTIH